MAELFRFRCFNCQKLMGAPPSKFGKTAHCPRCGVELIVPTPDAGDDDQDEPEDEENPDAVNLADLGVRLDPLALKEPAPASLRDPGFSVPGENPLSFLETPPPSPDPAPAEAIEAPPDPQPAAEVPINLAPRVSPITGRRPLPIADDLASRRRDVILPRTVVLAWALSALLGLGFAFASGLMIGHYLWQ